MENGMEALRLSASEWSLAGDRQLLDILQTVHQKIMTKCHETNSKLEQMVTDLDNASVSLQNVNNRFMALSNSQFVESRVYEDDADVCIEPVANKQPSQPPQPSALPALAAGLRRLGALHEAVSVAADSGSDSDSGQGESVILRPKDMYSERPLPYIIGSFDWRSKWHAGLINEDSDTDSDISKPDDKERAQYSDSESEAEQPNNLAVPRGYAGSTTSSDRSEETRQTTNIQTSNIQTANIQTSPPSQADIAAELARRLGGGTEVPIRSEMEDDIPEASQRKVYKPHQPSAGTVFCDEPPPLDPSSSEEDDIFAEINKNTPYNTHKAHSRGNSLGAERVDLFDDLQGVEASGYTKPPTQPAKQRTTLSDEDEDSDMFDNKPKLPPSKPPTAKPEKTGIKKPVGAISVFGNSKGGESIGAAILKRNQRKSSSSDEESSHNIDENEKKSKEKDIFDDLFAKSDKSQKLAAPKKNESSLVSKNVKENAKKVDLFNDDIFDDIDDIFSSNIPKVPVKVVPKSVSKVKSLFDDDDDDDLFADIVVNKSDVKDLKSDKKSKGPLDSDNNLFSEKPDGAKVATIEKVAPKPSVTAIVSQIDEKPKQSSRVLFDSDDELLTKKNNEASINNDDETKPYQENDDLITSSKTSIDLSSIKQQKTESLFEHETESDDIFSDKRTKKPPTGCKSGNEISSSITGETSHVESRKMHNNTLVDKQRVEGTPKSTTLYTKSDFVSEPKSQFRSPSLFGEDEDADLFKQIKSKDSTIETNISKDKANNMTKPSTANLETDKASNNLKSANVERKFDEDKISSQTKIINSPNIFGSDDDEDMGNNLFSQITKPRDYSTEQKDVSSNIINYSNVNKTEIVSKTDATSDISRVKDSNDSFETNTQSLHDTNKILDNEQTNLDANKNVEKDTVPTTVKNTVSNEQKIGVVPDIFADLPPDFEKPKEPKRSKNINALFDDDSDDEALFLRKEDNISDEKPTDVTNSNKEPMFALFHDEPPAIDIDFETKNSLTVNHPKSTETVTQSDENVPKKLESPKKVAPDNIDGVAQSKKEEIKPIGKLKPMNFNINVNTLLPGASPKKTVKPKNETADSPPESQEVKSKLVKSASFEKDPDSPVLNTKISKERAKIQVKRRPSSRRARIEAVRKSVIDIGDDVDGNEKLNDDANDNTSTTSPHLNDIKTENTDSESKVEEITKDDLNKANEIPMPPPEIKTQVLAINDDDVYIFRDPNIQSKTANDAQVSDNKTNIDKEVGIKTLGQVYEETKVEPNPKQLNIVDDDSDDDLFKVTTKVNTQPAESSTRQTNIFGDDDDDIGGSEIFKSKNTTRKQVDESGDKATISSKAGIFDDSDDDDMFKSKSNATNKSKANDSKPPKDTQPIILSKAEEISTDDEIFKTMKVNSKQSNQPKLENTTTRDGNISKNKEEPFQNVPSSSMENRDKVSKVKHSSDIKKTEINTIFDDLSDDELFGGKKKALDSDEELFSSKSKSGLKADITKPTEVKKVEVKKSLFDDDGDDDHLFGVKPKSAVQTTKPTKPAKEPTKTTEPVFDDPLSMLNDDEDF